MLCERFHVLPSQLDNEDNTRLVPVVTALNVHTSLRRVMETYLETHGKVQPTQRDWEIYTEAVKADKDTNA